MFATRTENAKKKIGSGKPFSMGNFHFLAAEKPTFGGGDFKIVRAVVLVVHDAIVTRLLREK